MIRIFLTCLAATLLLSCDRDVLVSEQWTWKDQAWVYGDAKTLVMESADTITRWSLDLKINHSRDYPYQNLYVRTVTTYPSGKEVTSVTSLELTDKKGIWTGDCNSKSCTLELPLQSGFTFPEIGTYRWSIEPYMRTDSIGGIKSLMVSCRRMKE